MAAYQVKGCDFSLPIVIRKRLFPVLSRLLASEILFAQRQNFHTETISAKTQIQNNEQNNSHIPVD
ncbi:MAG TPA: hypothetical protein PKJ43_07160, partial [Prolixibacteraceae bacterium]|nr:hypothetical protein [Prolixibacteraceae bacterium]